jgi:hypothetical protein
MKMTTTMEKTKRMTTTTTTTKSQQSSENRTNVDKRTPCVSNWLSRNILGEDQNMRLMLSATLLSVAIGMGTAWAQARHPAVVQ